MYRKEYRYELKCHFNSNNVWAIQRYQKTYLEISWDYPFKLLKFSCEIC
jgi:hypothetical protein